MYLKICTESDHIAKKHPKRYIVGHAMLMPPVSCRMGGQRVVRNVDDKSR